MRSIFLTAASAVLLSLSAMAQAPQLVNYQAAARNSQGNVLATQNISVRFTLRDGNAAGPVIFQETHSTQTSALGLFNLSIGSGTLLQGSLASADWSAGDKYIQVEIDPAGGSSYIDMGTSQLLSVPYALHAGNGLPAGQDMQTLSYTAGTWQAGSTLLVDQLTGKAGINSMQVIGSETFLVHQDVGGNDYGGMYVNTDEAAGKPFYGFANAGSARAWMYYDGSTDKLAIFHSVAGGDAFVINNMGYIGIGTAAPQATLHVQGTARLQIGGAASGRVLASTSAQGNAEWKTVNEVIPDMIRYVDIPANALGENPGLSVITRNTYGLNFTNDFAEGAKTVISVPADWDQVTPIELEIYFAKSVAATGTGGFFIRYAGGAPGIILDADPGSTIPPVLSLTGNAFTVYKQTIALSNITAAHEFIRLFGLQRYTTGTTYTGDLIVTHLRLKYNAVR